MAPSLTRLGRFELIERLGVGGFGSVWKARDKELDRTVAIKIPRAGGMTGEEQEKFFREARAAAQLRHPSIVSVHEVGRDGDSVYIVSDFVRGVTLGDWLTGQQLTNREAAELCAKIADALHHAHENGVVHRDLKPANIIIDYDGQPHLMDFGLARRESGEVTMTMDGQVLGTPAYMSPEQAQGEAHTADRRSDVYSLGVILFQLLTGELPFRGNARMLIKQVVQDEPPSPRKLNANIKRDLETITLKCLEKQPSKRYQSARELTDELRHFLHGEPIQARPVSPPERAVRWMRRNKMVSWLAASVALALLCGTVVSAYFAIDAGRQAGFALARETEALEAKKQAEGARRNAEARQKESEAVTRFLVGAFESPDPDRDGRTITVAEVLDRADKKMSEELMDQPLVRAQLLRAIGNSQYGLGLYKPAVNSFLKAKTLYEEALGTTNKETLKTMNDLVSAYVQVGRSREAIPIGEKALSARRQNLGADHSDTLTSMSTLAEAYRAAWRLSEAIQLSEQVLAKQREKHGSDDPTTLSAMDRLGIAYLRANRLNDAIALFEKTLTGRRKKLGDDHFSTMGSMNDLALAYNKAARFEEAIPLLEKISAAVRDKYGDEHLSTVNVMDNLAISYRGAGRLVEAGRVNKHFIEHGSFFSALSLSAKMRQSDVDQLMESALDYREHQKLPPRDAFVLGELRLVGSNPDGAEAAIRAAIQKGTPKKYYYKTLGWCLLAQRKANEARQAFQETLTDRRRKDGAFDLEKADPDEMTAAYFLDLISEQQYVQHVSGDKRLACFPWFYVGQRREFAGDEDGAITAYQRCVAAGMDGESHSVRALARWRLAKLNTASPRGKISGEGR